MKRFLLIVFFSFCFISSLFFTFPVHAQSQQKNSSLPVSQVNSSAPANLHNFTQDLMVEVVAAMDCQLTGIDPVNPNAQCIGINQKTHTIGFVPHGGGVIALVGQGISYLYTSPPATTGEYFSYLKTHFGGGRAYAASIACNHAYGIGFCGLSPLIAIWSTFRDFVYLLFALVFVVVGLGIMLRIKIDPRTVMSVQNQIPKIIIALIFVTFSFAIAGFLVDMMYVATAIVVNLFTPLMPYAANPSGALNMNNIESQNVIGYFNGLYSTTGTPLVTGLTFGLVNSGFWNLWIQGAHAITVFSKGSFPGEPLDSGLGTLANLIIAMFTANYNPVGWVTRLILNAFTIGAGVSFIASANGNINFGFIGTLIGFFLNFATLQAMDGGSLGGLIGLALIPITLLLALFRILVTLIKAYVNVLIQVCLAPFTIAFGIFPGENNGFMGWLKTMIANLAVFPATLFMMLLGETFALQFGRSGGSPFVPPLIGAAHPELLGPLIFLGMLFMIPSISELIQAAIKAPQGKSGAAIAHSAGAGNPMAMLGQVGSIGYSWSTLRSLPIFKRSKRFYKPMTEQQEEAGHHAQAKQHSS